MTRHRFACWRLRVWNDRLKRRRAIWVSALEGSDDYLFWEAQVTKALLRRAHWKLRACADCRRRLLRSAV